MEASAILLLEPEILARQPLAEYLRGCGFTVFEAASAAEARDLLASETIEIGIMLADASGDAAAIFTLAQWVRRSFPAIPVILAGTLDRTATQAGALCKEGPAVTKPYDHQLILKHIKRLLAFRSKS